MSKHTILFLAANPPGADRLALDREARAIRAELERSAHRDCFELHTRWAVAPLDLLRELRRLKPTILHFSGHGDRGVVEGCSPHPAGQRDITEGSAPHEEEPFGGLFFRGADGRAQRVTAAALQRTLGAAGASVRLVVLSACYSDAQAQALLAYVDCVVGMRGSIGDDAARAFAVGFYGGLGERESIATAYRQGCAAIDLAGMNDSDRPQLEVRDGISADELVLAVEVRPRTDAVDLRPRSIVRSLSRWIGLEIVGVALTLALVPARSAQSERSELSARIERPAEPEPLATVDRSVLAGRSALAERSERSEMTVKVERAVQPKPLMKVERPAQAAREGAEMTAFAATSVRMGVFMPGSRPPECAALLPTEDCAELDHPESVPQTQLEPYEIDRTEVTNAEFAVWLNANRERWGPPDRNGIVWARPSPMVPLVKVERCGDSLTIASDGRFHATDGSAQWPVVCVSWHGADAYCRAHGKRLPLEAEWEHAAKGAEARPFPWGSELPRHDGVAFDLANGASVHPRAVATSPQDVTPDGVHDLGGNVAEWVEDRRDAGRKTLRGGSFRSAGPCRLLSSGCQRAGAKGTSRKDVGFRCARSSGNAAPR